jgi:hypothetical protein
MALALLVGAPLAWLVLLQAGYVLAYQACDDRSSVSLHLLVAGGTAAAFLLTWAAWRVDRHSEHSPRPVGFLAASAFRLTALMLLVIAASAVAPFILHPCD